MAYENANEDCQTAILSIKETGDIMGYARACRNVQSETRKMQLFAQTLAASINPQKGTVKSKVKCFGCGTEGHMKWQCPKALSWSPGNGVSFWHPSRWILLQTSSMKTVVQCRKDQGMPFQTMAALSLTSKHRHHQKKLSPPTWGQLNALTSKARSVVNHTGKELTPEHLLLAMCALITCTSAAETEVIYCAHVPNPPLLHPYTWKEPTIVVTTFPMNVLSPPYGTG
ncbi:uncharacterized protein LOC115070575 [Nannospalax galili]|uniref:uncharacterized protein LOC115070575 n=1 Tax=Nannospalax galili TaxID=1026970 RepID=UPI00111C24CB|nr:uncharacterized protein LOC115070575 [Nannospalax galili]